MVKFEEYSDTRSSLLRIFYLKYSKPGAAVPVMMPEKPDELWRLLPYHLPSYCCLRRRSPIPVTFQDVEEVIIEVCSPRATRIVLFQKFHPLQQTSSCTQRPKFKRQRSRSLLMAGRNGHLTTFSPAGRRTAHKERCLSSLISPHALV